LDCALVLSSVLIVTSFKAGRLQRAVAIGEDEKAIHEADAVRRAYIGIRKG
jgi:hypothetical protein